MWYYSGLVIYILCWLKQSVRRWVGLNHEMEMRGSLSLLWTSFEYFKYFSDLKVCINYSVCEEPFSCLFILLVFIRESLRKMQHFHLEKNINLAFFQNCSVSFQTLLYTCLCILLERNTGSIKCTHACICVYIFTQKS